MRSVPRPASMSSASIFMPRTRLSPFDDSVSRSTSGLVSTKFDGDDRVADLLDVELGLLAGVRIEPLGVAHQVLRPFRGQQIELLHEIEELVRFPLRILEALVARRGLDRGLGVFAGHAAHGRTPEIEIGLAHLELQVGGAVLVGHPVFGDRAEGLDHFGDFVRRLVLGLAVLARLEIGGERLAAALHRARDIHRERFGVEFLFGLGLRSQRHSCAQHYRFVAGSSSRELGENVVRLTSASCCSATKHLRSDTLKPQRSGLVSQPLIVSGDNGLNDVVESRAADVLSLQGSYHRKLGGNWSFGGTMPVDRAIRALAMGALLVSALALGGCSTSVADLPGRRLALGCAARDRKRLALTSRSMTCRRTATRRR